MVKYVLSDVIVLWRAWVLWNRRVLLFIPPMISLICTIGTTIASAIYFFESFTITGIDDSKRILAIYLEWTIWFLTFGTNLWATVLIFIRAWYVTFDRTVTWLACYGESSRQHRRFLRSLSVKQTLKGKAEKALAFLIESGALYLFIWLLYILTSISLDTYGMFFFHTSMAQVVVRPPRFRGF
ncbi:hypothetical protein BC827DRAFT_3813 [Russula dissimulans]|nr:hypothetical protein BC827DRAFT_3813 [Russula dissimulans]